MHFVLLHFPVATISISNILVREVVLQTMKAISRYAFKVAGVSEHAIQRHDTRQHAFQFCR